MPRGVAARGSGQRRPEGVPVGFRHHQWVAACNVPLRPHEVDRFAIKARSDTKYGRPGTGTVAVRRDVVVLDVYCNRCGTRPGREEWCPRHPMADLPR